MLIIFFQIDFFLNVIFVDSHCVLSLSIRYLHFSENVLAQPLDMAIINITLLKILKFITYEQNQINHGTFKLFGKSDT